MSRIFLFTLMLAPVLLLADDEVNSEGQELTGLDTITVIAHRQPRQLSEIAGTVTVIGADRLERDIVVDLNDLVRYEPGVEVDGGGTRFGFGGFRIRGIGGNRTAVVIDNVPAPDRFTVGNFADTGRGLMELGLAERVEILRGPASTLYGSKALGGVVAVSLLDSDDVLAGSDQGSRLGLAAGTDARRARISGASAWRKGQQDLMLAAAYLQAGEVRVADRPADLERDDIDRRQSALLIRTGRETAIGRIRLSLDAVRDSRDSDLRAILGFERFVNTTELLGEDRRDQWRVLLDGHLDSLGAIDRGQWRLWHQQAQTRQDSFETRSLAPTPVALFRRFDFDQTSTGLGADLESGFAALGLNHRLGYGFELSRSDLSTQRDGLQTNLNTGQAGSVVLGERFPLRDFPNSDITELGIYLHNETQLGQVMFSPGLRYEYYKMSAGNDPLFESRFPDTESVSLSTSTWLPKLGLLWSLTEQMELFTQYARGFRAPPFEDVNIGLDIPMFNIRALPNPDLKPERGHTVEAGFRYRGPSTRAELAVFRNRYSDFIQTRAPQGFNPVSGRIEFQSINIDRVLIEGAELRIRQGLGGGFGAELAAEWIRGTDRRSGDSLPGISPPRLIGELSYQPASANWETRVVVSAVRAQRQLTDTRGDALYSPPGHATIDWLARWFPTPNLSVAAGLFNLTDRQYWRAASVMGRPADDPIVPLLAEPGRSAMITLNWRR